MAITYRSVKGSALTITELDNNFRYFTGSHAVTGSLISDGSLTVTGSLIITGSVSITGSISFNGLPTTEPTTTGSLWISGSGAGAFNSGSGHLMIFTG